MPDIEVNEGGSTRFPDDGDVDLGRRTALVGQLSQTGLAQMVSDTVLGCADMKQLAKELLMRQPVDVGKLKVGDLPENLRASISGLAIEQASAPVRVQGGVLVLRLCDREDFTRTGNWCRRPCGDLGRQIPGNGAWAVRYS